MNDLEITVLNQKVNEQINENEFKKLTFEQQIELINKYCRTIQDDTINLILMLEALYQTKFFDKQIQQFLESIKFDNDMNVTFDWKLYDHTIGYNKHEYDIKLFDGTILYSCYPNAGYFNSSRDNKNSNNQYHILEKDVEYIRFAYLGVYKTNEFYFYKYHFTTEEFQPSLNVFNNNVYKYTNMYQQYVDDNILNNVKRLSKRKLKHGNPILLSEEVIKDMKEKHQNRNEKCNCGSGKKYKKCCGTNNVIMSRYKLKK